MFSKDIKSYGDLVGEWAFRPHSGKPWRFVDRQLMEQDKDWVLLWPPQVHTTTKLARRVKHAEKRATAP